MANINNRVSTGLSGLDKTIDMLRLGDNVVWKVDDIQSYKYMVHKFIDQAKKDNRCIYYIRFGNHESLIRETAGITICEVDASNGFEDFAMNIRSIIQKAGKYVFYIFDNLSDLIGIWYSDLMIGNFFSITCPYLYELDTIAYFAIFRNSHTYQTIARIRETTQLFLDLHYLKGKYYVHPLKVWERYSPTMFFPHQVLEEESVLITSSTDLSFLFSTTNANLITLDYWDVTFENARKLLEDSEDIQKNTRDLLINLLIGKDSRIIDLCKKYFFLKDLLKIKSRQIGTGFIGGKSVGMLLARKILKIEAKEIYASYMELHDSYYLGSDIFYTYIVQNNLWKLRTKQKTKEGYFKYASELKDKLLTGTFPSVIKEQFIQMLEYFGQAPIIIRSSSLLEDNFGNAFAGKYESVFSVNQGTLEDRYAAFEQAVRTVYASVMNENALKYRISRGLDDKDEQMAILVQRVSGSYYDKYFYPHIAGVGNSTNLYVWSKDIDINAGMLRLVYGLGTRAVDRIVGDYPRIVSLDNPTRPPLISYGDEQIFSQHKVDLLDLQNNAFIERTVDEVMSADIQTDKKFFASVDQNMLQRMRENNLIDRLTPYILNFKGLFEDSDFPLIMRKILKVLFTIYDYPVDIEFTANFKPDGTYSINLLQCRPLQTRGLGKTISLPELKNQNDCLFYTEGNFMGGNVRLSIDYIVYVDTINYIELTERDKYSIARCVGILNDILDREKKNIMLIGPGRWGTTTPSLGVPVNFSEISNVVVLCEVAEKSGKLMPELSYGSHFFQDLVETGIFYVAIFDGSEKVVYNPYKIKENKNLLNTLTDSFTRFSDVIHVANVQGMELYSDTVNQRLICK
jgi:pyruvate, water dikinase